MGDVVALNVLALAGGYARQGDDKFFTESTLAELFQPVGVGSCVFALPSTPPVPNGVTVTVNGASVPRDTRHMIGWDYLDATYTSFGLYGTWCARLMDNRSFEIQVTYACPIFPVP